jgi:hypothetical protein
MKARKLLPVVVLVALAALAFLALPVALAGGPQRQSVRVTMQCDKGVTGYASVNLYDAGSNQENPDTQIEIYCGQSLVVATTLKAGSYAAVGWVAKASAGGSAGGNPCSGMGPLPATLYCSVGLAPVGERPAGGTLRLGKPK